MTEDSASRAKGAASILDDLVVVSNRQPYRHQFEGETGDSDIVVDRPTGGLTAGLDPVLQRLGGAWIAWGDGEADFRVTDDACRVAVPPDDPAYTLQRIRLSEAEVSGYYHGYANQALWPLCHTLTEHVQFDRDHWDSYRSVNRRFVEATADLVDDDSTVWFQDYHFGLAPGMLREETDAMLMQFWHIPWPASDVFRICPARRELLEGLLGNDLLGFHLPRYCENFLDCVEELVPDATVDRDAGRIRNGDHVTHVKAFPMGVDTDRIRRQATEASETAETFRRRHGIPLDAPIALGVDRLDYTKGIRKRLAGLERLWEAQPELRAEFTYVQKGVESRSRIPAYRRLQRRIGEDVQRINDRFGTDGWQPIVLTTEYLPQEDLCGLYRDADVGLVTPVRDGMNLVAKEYVAAQIENDGALVLSEFAGAHEQLGEHAITVNPYDADGLASAIERALRMDDASRRRRMQILRAHVYTTDIAWWIDSILEAATTRREKTEVLSA